MDIRIAGVENDSITDGPGLRLTVFAQGCPHNCQGCHNPNTHALDGGTHVTVESLLDMVRKNPLLDGVTLSGGEPFLQPKAMADFAEGVQQLGLNVIAYTGFLWEALVRREGVMAMLTYCDYVIDGKFEEELRSLELEFKGSSNQRLIGVKRSLAENRTVVYENFEQARLDKV